MFFHARVILSVDTNRSAFVSLQGFRRRDETCHLIPI